ncbi:hypothetical protein L218DRAFT_836527, partial [Marasmius fiardii PR-910]
LNYKKIPYNAVHIGFSDVEPTAKRIGAPPTGKKPDGSDQYTVPMLVDSSTGQVLSDSFLIALYLD